MTRLDHRLPAPRTPRRGRRGWLAPLLWLLIPVLAAVAPWAWRHGRTPRPATLRALPPVALTGDSRRDRQAILERAADLLTLPPAAPTFPHEGPIQRAATLGQIGCALLPLDRAKGTQAVERAIAMASRPADLVTAADLPAPEGTEIGLLVRLAETLRPYPDLATAALKTAFAEAQGNRSPASRVYALCLFAREAASVDPVWARSAARQASSDVISLRDPAPADPFAVVAAVVAQVESPTAARPFVQLALQSIPAGPARPLVEARRAAWLASAAPARAHQLAQQALADVGGQGSGRSGGQAFGRSGVQVNGSDGSVRSVGSDRFPQHPTPVRRTPNTQHPDPLLAVRQYHDVAVLLAVAEPDVAGAAVARLPTPVDRASTLVEMGMASETRAPARAATLYRRALREAQGISPGRTRQAAVIEAATGLAAFDLTAARQAVLALPGPVSVMDMLALAVRAVKRDPPAAGRLIEQMKDGDPAGGGRIAGGDELVLAQVATEPDLRRALVIGQQGSPALQAAALLTVEQRLAKRAAGGTGGERLGKSQTTKGKKS